MNVISGALEKRASPESRVTSTDVDVVNLIAVRSRVLLLLDSGFASFARAPE
jgi:hypothetical protein